jgi:hypothetical protein
MGRRSCPTTVHDSASVTIVSRCALIKEATLSVRHIPACGCIQHIGVITLSSAGRARDIYLRVSENGPRRRGAGVEHGHRPLEDQELMVVERGRHSLDGIERAFPYATAALAAIA